MVSTVPGAIHFPTYKGRASLKQTITGDQSVNTLDFPTYKGRASLKHVQRARQHRRLRVLPDL